MASAAFLALNLPCISARITLGYLYTQNDAAWLVESFAQFKLAVHDVNAAGLLGSLGNLTYRRYNARGSPTDALAGAISLLSDPDMIGLVGTGYSSAASAPARFCSLRRKPMISPGSTSIELADKTPYEYFMRSIANDIEQYKFALTAVAAYGWSHLSIVFSGGFDAGMRRFRSEAIDRNISVDITVELPATDAAAYSRERMGLALSMVQRSGSRILVALVRTVDMEETLHVAQTLGLLGRPYVWIGMDYTFDAAGGAASLPGYLLTRSVVGTPTSRRVAFDAAWPQLSRRYNQTADGPFDAASGLPFYDDTSATVWDADADGRPDYWVSERKSPFVCTRGFLRRERVRRVAGWLRVRHSVAVCCGSRQSDGARPERERRRRAPATADAL
jgi:hypothetical protein